MKTIVKKLLRKGFDWLKREIKEEIHEEIEKKLEGRIPPR